MIFNLFQKKPKTKYEMINWFGKTYDYRSYLEICTLSTGNYFDRVDHRQYIIKDCINYLVKEHEQLYEERGNAVGKDHGTPIAPFEEHLARIHQQNITFDLIFCDSFHSAKLTERDLNTALSLLNEGGTIIVHDCLPPDESYIGPYREGPWCGQSYEGYIRFINHHPEFEHFVFDTDYGCGVIRPNMKNQIQHDSAVEIEQLGNWTYFWSNRHWLLNLRPIDKFIPIYRLQGNSERAHANRIFLNIK